MEADKINLETTCEKEMKVYESKKKYRDEDEVNIKELFKMIQQCLHNQQIIREEINERFEKLNKSCEKLKAENYLKENLFNIEYTSIEERYSIVELGLEEQVNQIYENYDVEQTILNSEVIEPQLKTLQDVADQGNDGGYATSSKERQPQDKTVVASVNKYSFDYNMSHPRRGIAVIFNHVYFRDTNLGTRIGSKYDVIALESFLQTVGFEVFVYEDLTCQQIGNVLEKLSELDHSDYDCLWVTVLTHGLDGLLHANDYIYSYEDLYNPFKASKCLTLAGKPKIFVIQACRGKALDPGVELLSGTTNDSSSSYSIPSTSDLLIGFSTFSGFNAWRDPYKGTWYIQTLVNTLKELHNDMDLLSILTRVACLVGENYESRNDLRPDLSGKKQAPSVVTTLTRRVNFKLKNL